MGVPQNEWIVMENPIRSGWFWIDLEHAQSSETSTSGARFVVGKLLQNQCNNPRSSFATTWHATARIGVTALCTSALSSGREAAV